MGIKAVYNAQCTNRHSMTPTLVVSQLHELDSDENDLPIVRRSRPHDTIHPLDQLTLDVVLLSFGSCSILASVSEGHPGGSISNSKPTWAFPFVARPSSSSLSRP